MEDLLKRMKVLDETNERSKKIANPLVNINKSECKAMRTFSDDSGFSKIKHVTSTFSLSKKNLVI